MINQTQALQIAYNIKREIAEVNQALGTTNLISIFDMFGGGMMSSLFKRGGMVQIEQKMDHIQYQVSQLSDYHVYFVNDFDGHKGQYMDVLFDNIFSDMANQSRLNEAKRSLNRLSAQIDHLIMQLEGAAV